VPQEVVREDERFSPSRLTLTRPPMKKHEPRWLTEGEDTSGLKRKCYNLCEQSRKFYILAKTCSQPNIYECRSKYNLDRLRQNKLETMKPPAPEGQFLVRIPSEEELYGSGRARMAKPLRTMNTAQSNASIAVGGSKQDGGMSPGGRLTRKTEGLSPATPSVSSSAPQGHSVPL
jgi:hypothetical protein